MGLSENSSRGIAVIKEKITADPAVIFLVLRKDSVLKMKHEMIGDGRPEVLPGIPVADTMIDDFIEEVQQNTTHFTESVLAASETALRLQQVADTAANMGVAL